MDRRIFPNKLKDGDLVRVITPSRSLSIIGEESRDIANKRFGELGLRLSFGKHIEESDDFVSTSIESRIEDFHEAFLDKNVRAIITVIGGFNCNQLLDYIDWDIIRDNPKIFCGFSDITALNNSIFTRTGLVNYSGPHYSSFGQKLYVDYTIEYFKKALMSEGAFDVLPSREWSDDVWYVNQEDRHLIKNQGFRAVNEGKASGFLIGGNLCTLNLLQGTPYMPSLDGSILFIEDDSESKPHHFDRDLQSLIHLPEFAGVRGLAIGRFQKESGVNFDLLRKIVKSKKQLDKIPVIANVDFGHTDPKITFPVGGDVEVEVSADNPRIKILKH